MGDDSASQRGETILPLHAEMLEVARRRSATARVRVRVRTHERPEEVDEMLSHEDVTITRVPVGRRVDSTPPVREEDGLTIIPVMQEVLVVEPQLVLKEEVHIRRVRSTSRHHELVTLREQTATVERTASQEEPYEIPDVGGVQTKEDLR